MTTTYEQVQSDPAAWLERLRARLRGLVDTTGRSYADIAQETGIDYDTLTAKLTTARQMLSVEDVLKIAVACEVPTHEIGELFV